MFHNIYIKGFKSFEEEEIELKPLTILTGMNSSGKSSVIQAIRMIYKNNSDHNPLLEGYGGVQELYNSAYQSDLILRLGNNKQSFEIKSLWNSNSFINDDRNLSNNFDTGRIIYIGADRLGAQLNMPVSNSRLMIGAKGENILNVLDYYEEQNTNLDERLKPDTAVGLTFKYIVDGWLRYITPNVKFEYKVIRQQDNSFSQFNGHRATNVGFGLSYTLPIIVALLAGTINKDSVVLIENPEAHLHPKGQTEMARLIAKCVECGAQVIVETHSDHLVDGIRIYCKHNPGFNEKVLAHWFELDESNQTKVETINFSEDGSYTDFCPKGFFDQFEINANELLF